MLEERITKLEQRIAKLLAVPAVSKMLADHEKKMAEPLPTPKTELPPQPSPVENRGVALEPAPELLDSHADAE